MNAFQTAAGATTELLLLPNGEILVHNLTPAMATLLAELNPADRPMRERAAVSEACAKPVQLRKHPDEAIG